MPRRVGLTFAAQSLVQVGIFFKTGAFVCSALKSVWWRRKNVFHFCYVGDLGQQKKKKIDTRYNLRARMRGKCPELYTVCMCVFGCGKGLNPCQSLFSASRFEWKIYTQLPRWIPSLFVCVCARGKYTPATSVEYQSRNERWAVRSISWWLALGVFPREKNQSWHVFSACFPPSSESVSVSFGHGTQITTVGMGVENGEQNDWQFDKIALVLVLFGVYIASTGGELNCSFAALEFRW